MKKTRRLLPMEAVKALLVQGLKFDDVRSATGYSSPELSLLCKAWGIPRKQGRPRKAVR
jgi:hypothetical protein